MAHPRNTSVETTKTTKPRYGDIGANVETTRASIPMLSITLRIVFLEVRFGTRGCSFTKGHNRERHQLILVQFSDCELTPA